MIKIVVDCFGGDNSPRANIEGAILAMNAHKNFNVIFTGDENKINEVLKDFDYDKSRVEIVDCKEVISCEEQPTEAIKKKTDSSMVKAFETLNNGADAIVSTGSTGALLTGSVLKVGRVKGVSRPALAPVLPTLTDGNVVFVDVGANAECKPLNLFHFALMGSVYASEVLNIKNPRVALLSNGTEDAKGNELIKEVNKLFRASDAINFVGNIEARDIISGSADVVVSDGFSGNIALKGMEGIANAVFSCLKEEIGKSFRAKLGALLLKPALRSIKHKLDYNNKGGAIFLGAKKVVIKAHGSAKAKAVKVAVLQAIKACENNITDSIKDKIASSPLPELPGSDQ